MPSPARLALPCLRGVGRGVRTRPLAITSALGLVQKKNITKKLWAQPHVRVGYRLVSGSLAVDLQHILLLEICNHDELMVQQIEISGPICSFINAILLRAP